MKRKLTHNQELAIDVLHDNFWKAKEIADILSVDKDIIIRYLLDCQKIETEIKTNK